MQSLKTILLFEVMYRHNILGMSLNEIENQLKSYPTQDADDLLKRLRNDIATDELNREPETEDDISVTEAKQEKGGKDEYRKHFNSLLQKFGATNISELPPDKRKAFFNKIDAKWKSDEEQMKESREILFAEMMQEYNDFFAEFADIFVLIKKEIQVLDEASGKRTTMTKVTRQTKIDRAVGNLAVQYAKATNDPMYKKFKKFKDKWMKFKERIQAKYGPRVRTAARQGGGIGPILAKAGIKKDGKKAAPKKKK